MWHAASEKAARRVRVSSMRVACLQRKRSTQVACEEHACGMPPAQKKHAGCV